MQTLKGGIPQLQQSLLSRIKDRFPNYELSPVYAIATVLVPRFKLAVFSETNKRAVFQMVLDKMIELYTEELQFRNQKPCQVLSSNAGQTTETIVSNIESSTIALPLELECVDDDSYNPVASYSGAGEGTNDGNDEGTSVSFWSTLQVVLTKQPCIE
jgi:hypothetical protein